MLAYAPEHSLEIVRALVGPTSYSRMTRKFKYALHLPARARCPVQDTLGCGVRLDVPEVFWWNAPINAVSVRGLRVPGRALASIFVHATLVSTRKSMMSRKLQIWSVNPAAMAGVWGPGLTLDEARQAVRTADGTCIELTGVEFRLLRYFMSTRTQACGAAM